MYNILIKVGKPFFELNTSAAKPTGSEKKEEVKVEKVEEKSVGGSPPPPVQTPIQTQTQTPQKAPPQQKKEPEMKPPQPSMKEKINIII